MYGIAGRWLHRSLLLIVAAAPLAGCDDEASPTGPAGRVPLGAPAALSARVPELGSCQHLAPDAGSELVFHAYAEGVQIYRWDGSSWVLQGPSAVLYADAGGRGRVGTHYAGPTWRSVSGSSVVGTVRQRCPVDPADVAWLLLDAVPSGGPGVFQDVASIQRVNTAGGQPSGQGGFVGAMQEVPYTAEYYFYRAP